MVTQIICKSYCNFVCGFFSIFLKNRRNTKSKGPRSLPPSKPQTTLRFGGRRLQPPFPSTPRLPITEPLPSKRVSAAAWTVGSRTVHVSQEKIEDFMLGDFNASVLVSMRVGLQRQWKLEGSFLNSAECFVAKTVVRIRKKPHRRTVDNRCRYPGQHCHVCQDTRRSGWDQSVVSS